MVLLRRFESVAQIACRKGETPGFLHLYIGEEATGVGVCAHLRRPTGSPRPIAATAMRWPRAPIPAASWPSSSARRDGICGGRGGTMHLYDRSVGLFGTNGIVGAGIGHAVGIGMSARAAQGRDDIGVAFFGDGAANHGGFHEALNFAAVQQRAGGLRLREQPLRHRDAARRPSRSTPRSPPRPPSYGMPGVAVDGNDVLRRLAGDERGGRSGRGPATGRR